MAKGLRHIYRDFRKAYTEEDTQPLTVHKRCCIVTETGKIWKI